MVNITLEETLKKAQKKAADADTDPESYRDRVLSAARQAMKATKKDSIEIDHQKGSVRFSIDKTTDKIRMYINGEEVPEDRMRDVIADFDEINKPKSFVDKVHNVVKESGFTRRHGDMVFYGALRSAKASLEESNRTASSILGTILRILDKTISAR